MQRLISQAKPAVVIVEINRLLLSFTQTSEEQIRAWFIEQGYDVYADEPTTGKLIRLEPKQPFETRYVFNLVLVRPEQVQISTK
jgi:hypothetical protein